VRNGNSWSLVASFGKPFASFVDVVLGLLGRELERGKFVTGTDSGFTGLTFLYDSLTIDENGLLGVKLDKEVDYQAIFDLVDQEREARETRVGAGDELSALKFSAKQAQHYVNKGGKGFAKGGNKRPGVPIPHGAQRMRVQ
jgi:hypothetical protein